jgi:hypothetical protein
MSFEGHKNAMASCKFDWETVPEGLQFQALKAPEPAKGA